MPDVEIRPYQTGDIRRIPVDEPDPFDNWEATIEATALGLTSYYCAGQLIAVSYYAEKWDGVAMGVALINRELSAGNGMALAMAMKKRIRELMARDKLHRVEATSEPADKASRVFLRAAGYRYESTMRMGSTDKTDLFLYVITEANP